MREARVKLDTESCYHCVSRCINQKWYLRAAAEKQRLLDLLTKMARFAGITIINYCIMDNHFHVLIHVPDRDTAVDRDQLSERLRHLYGSKRAHLITEELDYLEHHGMQAEAQRRINSYATRMHDVSEFMKTVKQRFSESYNKRHNRSGTLWGGRFHSTLVEAAHISDMPLLIMGAYIDLNPVRAGLVKDPKNYRWCSYGAAVGGSKLARTGLKHLLECYDVEASWSRLHSEYRQLLYHYGRESKGDDYGYGKQKGSSGDEIDAVEEHGGELPWPEILQSRLSYFSRGLVLGSQVFVEDVMARKQELFEHRARPGPKHPPPLSFSSLHTAKHCR